VSNNELSPYILKRTGKEAGSEFEKALYEELVRRLGELRETTGVQIPLSSWGAWVLPLVTIAMILGAYFFWLFPKMF